MLNETPQKYALSSAIFMNGSGQMRRSTAEIYWLVAVGKQVTEYEVQQLIFMQKNDLYLPREFQGPKTYTGLFGDTDDEEAAPAAAEEAAPAAAEEAGPSTLA